MVHVALESRIRVCTVVADILAPFWRQDISNRRGQVDQRNANHDDVIKWKHFPRYWPICAGNSPVTGEFFPAQRPVTRRFDVFFDLSLNTRLSKQS